MQLVKDGSSGTINVIIREEAAQPLKENRKRRRDDRQKESEVMQVKKHILGVVHFLAVNGEGVEMPHDNALVVEAIIQNFKVQKFFMNGSKVNLVPYRVF